MLTERQKIYIFMNHDVMGIRKIAATMHIPILTVLEFFVKMELEPMEDDSDYWQVFIISNHKKMTRRELSNAVGFSYQKVSNFCKRRGLITKPDPSYGAEIRKLSTVAD